MFGFLKKDDRKVINVNDIDGLIGSVELIDIRELYEFKSGSIKTAKNIPMGKLLRNPEKYMVKDKTYYIICQSGVRSASAVRALTKKDFDLINVTGGLASYMGRKRQ